MAGEAAQAAKRALADWYGHSGACWTCNTPDGVRCDAGAELHDRFMAACQAAGAVCAQIGPAVPCDEPLW